MFVVSKEEAMFIRKHAKGRVHVRVCNVQAPARARTYYADESPLTYALLERFWDGIKIEHLEVNEHA